MDSAQNTLSYDDICRIVGSIILDSHRRISTIESQSKQLVTQLQSQLEILQLENAALKKK